MIVNVSKPLTLFHPSSSSHPSPVHVFTIFSLNIIWSNVMLIEKEVNLIKSGANLGLRSDSSAFSATLPGISISGNITRLEGRESGWEREVSQGGWSGFLRELPLRIPCDLGEFGPYQPPVATHWCEHTSHARMVKGKHFTMVSGSHKSER